ncbi:TPA: AAA family ATPase, partial [Vibrio parahaemolyticus]|nr:AAA family ATPase [Vibrio parahaemolyticus]
MKIDIKNLGNISEALIDLKDLTIICGPNSSNKTWLSYALYHYLSYPKLGRSIAKAQTKDAGLNLKNSSEESINMSEEGFRELVKRCFTTLDRASSRQLHMTFNSSKEQFEDFTIYDGVDESSPESAADSINALRANNLINSMIENEVNYDQDHMSIYSPEHSNLLTIKFDEFSLEGFNAFPGDTEFEKNTFYFSMFIKYAINTFFNTMRPFAITSERVGCLAFQKDIDGTSLRIKDRLESLFEEYRYSDSEDIHSIIKELSTMTLGNRASIPVPVRKNLEALRNAEEELKKESFLKNEHPEIAAALQDITAGSFLVEKGNLNYVFGDVSDQVPVTIASSSIKSLFHLDLYISSLAKRGDILLIDEPELNLHPNNQRKMAKVLNRLVNAGIKVLITTHSDYLVREINNSIMLSNHFDERANILEKYSFTENDTLKPSQVSAYM